MNESPSRWRRLQRWIHEEVHVAVWIVLGLVVVGALVSEVSRSHHQPNDVTTALVWAQTFLGIVLLLSGGLQALLAVKHGDRTVTGLTEITPGIVGALVGAMLLGIGGWGSPVALGAIGVTHLGAQIAAFRAAPPADRTRSTEKPPAS